MDTATTSHTTPNRVLRSIYGSPSAEAFLIVAICTILITRLYLHLTDYPQVGGSSLHIAHALYGGAAMMIALLVGWIFLGIGARILSVLVGGIGFGLFLDEIGKFVTPDNDYFYGPSAEIMYVLVVAVLVAVRVLRDFRQPTAHEYLANAADIAVDSVVHGLPAHRRATAIRLLDNAEAAGADGQTCNGVRQLIDAADHRNDRLHSVLQFAPRLIPGFLKSRFWVPIVGWLLVLASFLGVAFGVAQLVAGGLHIDNDDAKIDIDEMGISSGILFASAVITFSLALPAVLTLNRPGESGDLLV